ncbi:hypothetical protein A2954_03480 [Candidatus Roizmanbacteria bacterium RIFCSPLOWO2_01_FULL_37_12]|uniref:Ribbon-helix-helix protein CopG domain-containing protein n=1 Tax=Candidatus Roizmanbacteria bacterium RIFCSPLOWO2_01_FULL_37_12 TaxID=1802056 RepID=A0A1F7IF93_9BACT|nr:MAG: hypothetical protein A3D76_06690 [Candidatus Roizmanbacteria bacterium RIFCSPHIGHO2_02_FULL_37_9b]OGK42028.1 MAG: hypothetical protein A2954_03480 [Candidatus Roizmanbacteria bacterium RIFCSPLOWO2_01_FULL_37_12]
MKIVRLLSSDDKVIRTQISLTTVLKKLIEDKASLRGESLSEYLRKAAMLKILLEEDEKEELEKLTDMVIGSVNLKKHPYWSTPKKVRSWVRNLRSEWK